MLKFLKRALLRRFGIRVTVTWDGDTFTHFAWSWPEIADWVAQYPAGVAHEATA